MDTLSVAMLLSDHLFSHGEFLVFSVIFNVVVIVISMKDCIHYKLKCYITQAVTATKPFVKKEEYYKQKQINFNSSKFCNETLYAHSLYLYSYVFIEPLEQVCFPLTSAMVICLLTGVNSGKDWFLSVSQQNIWPEAKQILSLKKQQLSGLWSVQMRYVDSSVP